MTIKDAVKAAIAALPGNKTFTVHNVPMIEHADGANELTIAGAPTGVKVLSREQISRAIRDLSYVRRKPYQIGYRVKGRCVPQR